MIKNNSRSLILSGRDWFWLADLDYLGLEFRSRGFAIGLFLLLEGGLVGVVAHGLHLDVHVLDGLVVLVGVSVELLEVVEVEEDADEESDGIGDRVAHEAAPEAVVPVADGDLSGEEAEALTAEHGDGGGGTMAGGLEGGHDGGEDGHEGDGGGHVAHGGSEGLDEGGGGTEHEGDVGGEDVAKDAEDDAEHEGDDDAGLDGVDESAVELGTLAEGEDGEDTVTHGEHGEEDEEGELGEGAGDGDDLCGLDGGGTVGGEGEDETVGDDGDDGAGDGGDEGGDADVEGELHDRPIGLPAGLVEGDDGTATEEVVQTDGTDDGLAKDGGGGGTGEAEADVLDEDGIEDNVDDGTDDHHGGGVDGGALGTSHVVAGELEVADNVEEEEDGEVLGGRSESAGFIGGADEAEDGLEEGDEDEGDEDAEADAGEVDVAEGGPGEHEVVLAEVSGVGGAEAHGAHEGDAGDEGLLEGHGEGDGGQGDGSLGDGVTGHVADEDGVGQGVAGADELAYEVGVGQLPHGLVEVVLTEELGALGSLDVGPLPLLLELEGGLLVGVGDLDDSVDGRAGDAGGGFGLGFIIPNGDGQLWKNGGLVLCIGGGRPIS